MSRTIPNSSEGYPMDSYEQMKNSSMGFIPNNLATDNRTILGPNLCMLIS
jgi:hypothetical protein